MANRKVIALWYCKTPNGWRRYPIVIGGNGRIKLGYVKVKGVQHHYPEGHFELRCYQGSKAVYKNIGNDPSEVLNKRDQEAQLLIARDAAKAGGAVLVEETGRVLLSKRATKFVQAAKDRGAMEAASIYERAIKEFLDDCQKTYADQVTKEDIAAHHLALKKRGASERTIHNRHRAVKSFLQDCGVSKEVLGRGSPRYEKTTPEIYDPEELRAFFDSIAGDDYHTLIFDLFLKTGVREQEGQYLEWPDILFHDETLKIRSKPELGFRIKDKEERGVPLERGLVNRLKAYKRAHPKKRFVLGNSKDQVNTHLLRLLKRLVHRGGLNCDRCEGCRKSNECERWYLHKFRASYCTQLLRSGMDLRTVQKLMGHSDIESTMRYLRPQDDSHTKQKINSIKWG